MLPIPWRLNHCETCWVFVFLFLMQAWRESEHLVCLHFKAFIVAGQAHFILKMDFPLIIWLHLLVQISEEVDEWTLLYMYVYCQNGLFYCICANKRISRISSAPFQVVAFVAKMPEANCFIQCLFLTISLSFPLMLQRLWWQSWPSTRKPGNFF